MIRLPFGLVVAHDPGEAILTAGEMFDTKLTAALLSPEGELVEYQDLGSGLVTNAGVEYMAQDFAGGTQDIGNFNNHGVGIGTTAAAVTDTALVNTTGAPARVTGTKSNPAAGQYRTVATVAFTSSLAITEWGLFSAATAGTLWDRRVFAAINVNSGDSIEFSYTLTINAGG